MESKALREQRKSISLEMAELVKKAKHEARHLTAEEQGIFDRMENECQELLEKAEGFERMEKFDRLQIDTLDKQKDTKTLSLADLKQTDMDKAVRGWLCSRHHETKNLASQYVTSADRCGIDYHQDRIALRFGTSDQSTIAGGLGAEFVPTTLANFVYRTLLFPSNIRQLARMLRTATGETFDIPVSTDTAEAVLIAQNAADSVGDLGTDLKSVKSYCLTTKMVNIPVEWLRGDAIFPAEQFVGEEFGRRYERGSGKILAQGAGTTEPQGYNNAAISGVVAVDAAVGFADMIALYHDIPLAYREDASFAFRCSDAVMKSLRTELDGNDRPLWEPSIQVGQPDRYYGKPIYSDQYLDDLGTNGNVCVVGGAWSEFLIREVASFEVWNQQNISQRQITLVGFGFLDSLLLSDTALQSIVVSSSP